MSKKRFRFMFASYFIIFGIIITIISAFIGYELQMMSIDENIEKNAQEIAYNQKQIAVKPIIDKMQMLVLALTKNKSLQEFVTNKDEHLKEEYTNLLLTIAMTDPYIMQVEFIDEMGKGTILINRKNMSDKPLIIEENKLQNKNLKNYFNEVKNKGKNKVWYSKIDLNIENGNIEVPYKPTILIGTSLYTKDEFKGIILIKLLATEILNKLNQSTEFNHYIIDKEGNFISHPNEKYSFSKYTNTQYNIYDEFPIEASNILKGENKGDNIYSFSLADILDNADEARLILKHKQGYMQTLIKTKIEMAIYVLLLSTLIGIPLAMYASIIPLQLQKSLLTSKSDLERFNEVIDKYVITATTDKDGIAISVSEAFLEASGYIKKEVIGQNINILNHKDTPKEIFKDLWGTIEQGKRWHKPIQNKKKDGTSYWLEQNIIPIKNEKFEITSYMAVGIDITAKKELERTSIIDKLTKIYNRRKLDDELKNEHKRAMRYMQSLSILLIDIDYFKKINDNYGHQAGDDILQDVSKILKESIRDSDILGRFGGEEFMIICPQSNQEQTYFLAEKLRKNIEEFKFNHIKKVTISVGVASCQVNQTIQQLIKIADDALYKAKKEGRNKVIIGGLLV